MTPDGRPLLSITIPTYNRSVYLAELLECLQPQLAQQADIELLISDNASPDDSEAVTQRFAARGLDFRYIRNATNIGPDGNFIQCLDFARGKYVWVLGDDDLMAPGTIPQILDLLRGTGEYDLVYLSSVGFTGDQRPRRERDPLGRFAEVVTDGDFFMQRVNAMITLVSANIVNKDKLLATPHPPIGELNHTFLLQLGWLLPVIHRRCRILYVWERLLFHRAFNSGGWGICDVFGLSLNAIARRYFASEPSLADNLMNGVVSMWLPDHIMQMRRGDLNSMESEQFSRKLGPVYNRNWRYWFFVYPVANAPLAIAKPIHRFNRLVMKALRTMRMIAHHLLHRGQLLHPPQLP